MGIWDKIKRAFGRGSDGDDGGGDGGGDEAPAAPPRAPAAASAPASPPASARPSPPASAPAAPPPSPPAASAESMARYQASEILGLSMAEVRKRSLKIDPYRTPWIGRVDTIPPQSDERTALIDRGLMLRGLLTREQLDEIHRIGDLWIRHHDAVSMAAAVAHGAATQAIEADRADREVRKAEKRRQAAERAAARAADVARRRATDIVFAGRGVSARLHDRRAHVEQLAQLGVPVLATPADLAAALGLSIPQLRWLCFHAEAAHKTHYVYFEVPKRSGGTRLLAAPHARLAAAQRWVLDHILARLEVTAYAHGFVTGRSTITNARLHVGRDIVVNLDLAEFFPTITFPRVRGLFESIGYSPAVATLLALLCTEAPRSAVVHDGVTFWVAAGDRALPQGACTSPAISNLVTRKLDRRLAGATRKLGWTYTRYADDLTFSTSSATSSGTPSTTSSATSSGAGEAAAGNLALLLARVRHIVRDEGFTVNERKGRIQRRSQRQSVTGIVVNDKPGVPREELRRLRAILHRAKTTGLAAQNRDQHPDFTAYLRGKIAYIAMIDPARAAPLTAALDALV